MMGRLTKSYGGTLNNLLADGHRCTVIKMELLDFISMTLSRSQPGLATGVNRKKEGVLHAIIIYEETNVLVGPPPCTCHRRSTQGTSLAGQVGPVSVTLGWERGRAACRNLRWVVA